MSLSEHGIEIVAPLAYRGKAGCQDVSCTRYYGPDPQPPACLGWHCAYCDAPCGSQGHGCDVAETLLAASLAIAKAKGETL